MRRALTTEQRELRRVRDAAAAHLPATGVVLLDGVPVKTADFLADLDATLATFEPVTVAKAAWKQARAQRAKALAHTRQQVACLKPFLVATLKRGGPELAAFGFEPKVRRALTAEQKALKAAKTILTRKARGTKGARQKREITTEGQPGLMLVNADGTPVPGIVKGPKAPAK